MGNDLISIAGFFVSVLTFQMLFGEQVVYWYLMLIFLGIILFQGNKHSISIGTPEIMQDNKSTTHQSGSGRTHGGGGRTF